MSTLAVLNAERIKLSTTRSSLWIAVAVAGLSLMLAALQGVLSHEAAPLMPDRTSIGVAVFGVPVLMVLASMTVTAEYRTQMIRTTFIATPNRTRVLMAKAIVVSVFSALYAALLVLGSVVVATWFTVPSIAGDLALGSPAVWRAVVSVAIYAAAAAVLGVAVGALLRAGPGAVAALLLWPLVAEPVLANLPDVGARVGPYLPFANIFVFTEVPWLYPVYAMPWERVGSLVYFLAVVAAVVGAAIVVLNTRDA